MDKDTRRELEASLAARKDLGPEYEDHLVERFLEKVDKGLARGREEDRRPNAIPEKALAIPLFLLSGGIGDRRDRDRALESARRRRRDCRGRGLGRDRVRERRVLAALAEPE